VAFVAASDADGAFTPDHDFPLARCPTGCDLTYRIRIASGPTVLPASVIRYAVDVRLQYDGFGARDDRLMRLELEGETGGPVASVWSLLGGLFALVGGIALGPALHRRLRPGKRDWPARALVVLTVGLIGWMVLAAMMRIVAFDAFDRVAASPLLLLAVVDPWSTALLGTLTWGVWRGLRRWPDDGGWLLGLAGVATVGLGGLWLAWWLTRDVVVQPLTLAGPFVLLGGLGGAVIGQAWRTDPRAADDRGWGALAVLGNGIVIAGFGFQAQQFLFDPFSSSPTSLLALVPALLVAWAFRRWLRGLRGWLILFDVVIAAIGLLGLHLWTDGFVGFTTEAQRTEIDDVAVGIAVAAAVVAAATSFIRLPRRPDASPVPETPAAVRPPSALVDDRPTT
jgi:hypothetical protein